MTVRTLIGASIALALLAACGEDEIILPGERLDIRDKPAFVNQTASVSIPAARTNAAWTHRNGGADHQISHPALGNALAAAFVAPIGEGDSLRARITADPVVSNGVVYTLDARTTVTATSVTGQTIWSRVLTTGLDGLSDASGGGVSVAGDQLYVTTGFGEISALDIATGAVNWTQDLDAPALSPPTINGDLVYVVARDSTGWALDTTNGRIRWQISSNPSVANFSGSASPATNGDIVVFPFPSGEVVAAFPKGGQRRWAGAITGDRIGRAAALVTDITSDPVIDGDRLYVGNFGGRVAALDLLGGERIWTASEGAVSPVWPVGNAVFLINDISELVRLDTSTGQPVWRIALPDIVGERKARQREFVGHYGPILAGGRLIVASTDGLIRQFDPPSGALIGTVTLPGGAASHPVVAGQTLYVVSKAGQLHAFR